MSNIKIGLLLTFEELAARWRISVRTLQRLVGAGKAPPQVRIGKRVLFHLTKEADHD